MNALVSGGTRGIGRAISLSLLERGYSLFILYSSDEESREEMQKICLERGYKPTFFKADISDEEQVKEVFSKIRKITPTLDVLVNNAGISLFSLLQTTSLEEWNRIFAVNVTGAFLLSKNAIPMMLKRQSGRIINVSSVWGEVGASCEVAYSASKAALIGFTKALAKELAPSKITVNCVSCGVIDTKMNDRLSQEDKEQLKEEIPLCRFGTGEDIAKAVLFFLDNDYVTGQVLSVNGGFVI